MLLENDEWKYDNIPEIYNGKNVADFYDTQIEEKLAELEKEEDYLLSVQEDEIQPTDDDEKAMFAAWKQVRGAIVIKRNQHDLRKKKRIITHRLKEDEVAEALGERGVDADAIAKRVKKRETLAKLMGVGKKIKGEDGMEVDVSDDDDMDVDDKSARELLREKKMGFLKGRMSGADPKEHSLKIKEPEAHDRLKKKIEKRLRRCQNVHDSDRMIQDTMPKHLNSGKRGIGSTDRR